MFAFYIVNISLLLLIFALLILLSAIWPPDSPWSPWWKTDRKTSSAIIKLAKITKKDVVYELGSGDGEFCLFVAKKVGAKCVGIEIDPLRHYQSRLRAKFQKTGDGVNFLRKDFKKVNVSPATVVYFYLVPKAIERILPKLKKELRPGTRIISYKYEAPLKQIGEDENHKLYLYKI